MKYKQSRSMDVKWRNKSKKSQIFGPYVADKYASSVTNNLGLGCNSCPYSAINFLITNPSFGQTIIEIPRNYENLICNCKILVFLQEHSRMGWMLWWAIRQIIERNTDYIKHHCTIACLQPLQQRNIKM